MAREGPCEMVATCMPLLGYHPVVRRDTCQNKERRHESRVRTGDGGRSPVLRISALVHSGWPATGIGMPISIVRLVLLNWAKCEVLQCISIPFLLSILLLCQIIHPGMIARGKPR